MKHHAYISMSSIQAYRKYTACLLVIAALVIFMPKRCFPETIKVIQSETITGQMKTENGFEWRYGYDIFFVDERIVIKVGINLIPAEGVAVQELERVKKIWEKGIERIWSDRYSILMPSGHKYPIIIDVYFKGNRFHHDVIVRPGEGRSDALNWKLTDSPEIAAHEFGHILGVFDEYRGGATAPQSPVIDSTSIMTANPTSGCTYARHYSSFQAWFVSKTSMKGSLLTVNGEDNEKEVSTPSNIKGLS